MIRLVLFLLLTPICLVSASPHVILISVDTLRVDHLGCYGYYKNTSPSIDQLAKEGIRFNHCLTESPLTVPSLATVMTSLSAYKHGAKRNGLSIYEGMNTLAGSLGLRGYITAAFISNWPLKDRLSGLGKGFVHYDEVFTKKRWMGLINPEGEAPDVNMAVQTWLDHRPQDDAPLFLWIHYTEPHAPYVSHKEFNLTPFEKNKHGKGADRKKIDHYDSEIAYTDRYIGELMALLKERKLYQDSLIVFIADHGESFGEHDYYQHGRKLYNTCLHVPLIIRLPQGENGNTSQEGLVSLIDIAPTILAATDTPAGQNMEGQNVLATDFRKEFVFSEAFKGASLLKRGENFKRKVHPIRYSISTADFKLIFNQSENTFEAYRLPQDKFEEQDCFENNHEQLRLLRTQLIAHIRDLKTYLELGEKKYKQPSKLTQDDLDKLKTLGYID